MDDQLEEPLFNIGAVARMTDIPEATLRMWERRYDFPKSSRTSGGHRLYSQENVFRLQWVKARMNEGMQVRQAIRALRRVEQDGAFTPDPSRTSGWSEPVREDTSLSVFHKRLLDALSEHNLED